MQGRRFRELFCTVPSNSTVSPTPLRFCIRRYNFTSLERIVNAPPTAELEPLEDGQVLWEIVGLIAFLEQRFITISSPIICSHPSDRSNRWGATGHDLQGAFGYRSITKNECVGTFFHVFQACPFMERSIHAKAGESKSSRYRCRCMMSKAAHGDVKD